MKPKNSFTPQTLRAILSVLLFLIVVAGAGAFYLGLGMVSAFSEEVNQTLVDAQASNGQSGNLQSLQSQLNENESLVQKTQQFFTTPENYQSQAIGDIQSYAAHAGLSVADIVADPTAQYRMTVTLSSPAPYDGLITFLSNIEGSLPKMQVASISLGGSEDASSSSVVVNEIKIDIAVQ